MFYKPSTMPLKSVFVFIFSLLSTALAAQQTPQVLNTAGLYLKGQNTLFDVAIGELVTTANFNASACATQGFLQPKPAAPINQINLFETTVVNVYPNPFTSTITIATDNNDLHFTVATMTAQVLIGSTKEKTIDLSAYPSGIYLLTIYNAQNEIMAIHKLCKLTN